MITITIGEIEKYEWSRLKNKPNSAIFIRDRHWTSFLQSSDSIDAIEIKSIFNASFTRRILYRKSYGITCVGELYDWGDTKNFLIDNTDRIKLSIGLANTHDWRRFVEDEIVPLVSTGYSYICGTAFFLDKP